MKIDEVITEAIIAIYQSNELSDLLILKGGGAIRLFDGLDSRLSIDADFSTKGAISAEVLYTAINTNVARAFDALGYDVIDLRVERRPKKRRKGFPEKWGGWSCKFKLVDSKHGDKTQETRRRNALVPEGANSSVIELDISEYEFCGKQRKRRLHKTWVKAYSREMLVLEKIRAICQQHPDYPYRQQSKNRARDFYDIYQLTNDINNDFVSRCRRYLKRVFDAKWVSLELLEKLWDDEFVDEIKRGFPQVRDSVKGKLYDFDVYLEHLRFLVREIQSTSDH